MDTEIANAGSTSFKNEDIISIHAPVKGATSDRFVIPVTIQISIHAPAKGATCIFIVPSAFIIPFQSTLPRRERPQGM